MNSLKLQNRVLCGEFTKAEEYCVVSELTEGVESCVKFD